MNATRYEPGILALALLIGAGSVLAGCRWNSATQSLNLDESSRPPQSMIHMDAVGYSGPAILWSVKSPKADVLDNQETIYLQHPDMKSFKNGRLDSTLVAERGWMDTTRQSLLAQDNAVVTSTDGARLESPWLIIDNRTQMVHSTATCRIIRPGSITSGNNLLATMDLSSVSLTHERVEIPKNRTEKKKK